MASSWNLYTYLAGGLAVPNVLGYRPLSWSIPLSLSQITYIRTNVEGFFFDAVLREEHSSSLRITEHPVQSGANISDHAFFMPARLVLDIGMSDVMASYVIGQYPVFDKSVNCYQKMLALQKTRTPLTVITRLRKYTNMLIEQIFVPADGRTTYGARIILNLKQIITAMVGETSVPNSVAENTTDATQKGSVTSSSPSDTSVLRDLEDKFSIMK